MSRAFSRPPPHMYGLYPATAPAPPFPPPLLTSLTTPSTSGWAGRGLTSTNELERHVPTAVSGERQNISNVAVLQVLLHICNSLETDFDLDHDFSPFRNLLSSFLGIVNFFDFNFLRFWLTNFLSLTKSRTYSRQHS